MYVFPVYAPHFVIRCCMTALNERLRPRRRTRTVLEHTATTKTLAKLKCMSDGE